jgi:hypothetical protein
MKENPTVAFLAVEETLESAKPVRLIVVIWHGWIR